MGNHTARGNGHPKEELVELLVVAHRQLNVARHNARALVVAGSIACKFQDFGRQILQYRGQEHGSPGANTLGVPALAEMPVDAAHGENQARTLGASGGAGGGRGGRGGRLFLSRHDEETPFCVL